MSSGSSRGVPPEGKGHKGEWVYRALLDKNKVYFIRHALDRMKQRGVFQNEVFEAIKSPAETDLPTQPGRKRVRWYRSERTAIEVVYEELDDCFRIISVNRVSSAGSQEHAAKKKTPKTRQRRPGRRGKRQ
jgi:hypothetical protein